jgi:hypothetical protein
MSNLLIVTEESLAAMENWPEELRALFDLRAIREEPSDDEAPAESPTTNGVTEMPF